MDQWVYDAAGHVLNDTNSGYEYDAEGRVEKVLVSGFGTPQATTTVENEYLLGLDGEQVSVLGSAGNWLWTNVYAGGNALATYDNTGTHFSLTDWLGSKRALVNITGASTVAIGEQCQNLPFGDGQNCTGTDPNQLHFTGKQRDPESTNDYFGARYYGSTIGGRFLSPDYSDDEDGPQAIPYYNPTNPQTLNLYSYVQNNPLSKTDPDGHDVNVCTRDTFGNQQCSLVSNDQYNAAQQAGNGSLNVPTLDQVGTNGSGNITDANENTVGTATYVPDSGVDFYGNQAAYNTLGAARSVVNTLGAVEITAMSFVAPELLADTAIEGGLAGGATVGETAGLTEHGAQRLAERGISPEQAQAAIKAARAC